MTDNIKQIEELFKIGAHLGHKKNKVHPKAKKYIYSIEEGSSIIDLSKTVEMLKNALDFVKSLAKENKTLLIVVTKKISSQFTKDLCQANLIPYITVKWPAGLLTNFEMIIKNVKKLEKMLEEKEKGVWNKFVKHEQLKLAKELNRLERFYGGLIYLKKLPDAIFIVDIKKEKNAVEEARKNKIPLIAVVDTNVNPDLITYPIPANDDSLSSIQYFVSQIVDAYTKGKK